MDCIVTLPPEPELACEPKEQPGLRVPFGRSTVDGLYYEPRAVPLGKDCQCECPACGRTLYAKHCLDGKVIPHFQHAPGITCREGYETAIHFAAKQVIDAERRLFFPELSADVHVRDAMGIPHDPSELIVKAGVRELSQVDIEKSLGEIRPDLIVTADDLGIVLVEIAVTHFVKSEKLGKAQRLAWPLLELDLSELRNASFAELRELIFNRADNRKWLFHPAVGPAMERLEISLQPVLDAARTSREEMDKREEQERERRLAEKLRSDAIAADMTEWEAPEWEEAEQQRRQAEKLRRKAQAEQRQALRKEQARAIAFKELPENEKAGAIARWLKRDDLPRLVSFPVRGDRSFGLTKAWIWQAALFGSLLNKLATPEATWVTPTEMVAWLSERFRLTPEFPDSEKRAVWNYLDGLCKRGALVQARGGRFRPAVAHLSAYALQLAVRLQKTSLEQLTWVDEAAWPNSTVAYKVAEAHANASHLPAVWQRICTVRPVARSQSPLYIAQMYGQSGLGPDVALDYLICAGFLQVEPRVHPLSSNRETP